MGKFRLALLGGTLFLFSVGQASATTIRYSEQAIASGTLGANSFTNTLVTFSWTGDTTNVFYSYSDQIYSNSSADLSTIVTISGLGSASFLYGMYVFSDQNYKVGGFGNWNSPYLYLLDTADATFGSYDLKTAIGPITNTGNFVFGSLIPTDHGYFNISSLGGNGSATFTATVEATTPESGTLALFGSGCLALIGVLRRRFS